MKKLFIPAILLLAIQIQSCQSNSSSNSSSTTDSSYVDTTHTSQNSLDWAGTYDGIVPCADCSGIKTTITLKDDDSFTYQAEYLEKNTSVQDSGKFMWHDNGSIVHLMGKDLNTKYKVGENILIQLDTEGKVIEGAIAEKYYLNKVQ
ncbi:copper resistance protein NlpE [Sphingobacterium rhinopitheci]|uniref:copper resistance protein NlpE n=1 Tax=Sphingobacterium rhinopitheci TaxID=2781960 RepID=UPI001F51E31E|nr:copper resistance protein NlpE [Sphingobacterium rhinopitheci]MCI0920121.1 copper resistance protein NlpE N-terminal domain-containing protein [Sphingobacterium rhinopitheci]